MSAFCKVLSWLVLYVHLQVFVFSNEQMQKCKYKLFFKSFTQREGFHKNKQTYVHQNNDRENQIFIRCVCIVLWSKESDLLNPITIFMSEAHFFFNIQWWTNSNDHRIYHLKGRILHFWHQIYMHNTDKYIVQK